MMDRLLVERNHFTSAGAQTGDPNSQHQMSVVNLLFFSTKLMPQTSTQYIQLQNTA